MHWPALNVNDAPVWGPTLWHEHDCWLLWRRCVKWRTSCRWGRCWRSYAWARTHGGTCACRARPFCHPLDPQANPLVPLHHPPQRPLLHSPTNTGCIQMVVLLGAPLADRRVRCHGRGTRAWVLILMHRVLMALTTGMSTQGPQKGMACASARPIGGKDVQIVGSRR